MEAEVIQYLSKFWISRYIEKSMSAWLHNDILTCIDRPLVRYLLTNILVVWKPKIKPRKREMIKRYRKRNEESTRGKIVAMKLMYHTSSSALLPILPLMFVRTVLTPALVWWGRPEWEKFPDNFIVSVLGISYVIVHSQAAHFLQRNHKTPYPRQ